LFFPRERDSDLVEAMGKSKTDDAPRALALIRKPELMQLLGNPAPSTLWSWMSAGRFPLAVELGPPGGRSSAIAWYRHEIEAWLANRPRRVLGQHEFRGRPSKQARKPPKQIVAR
jgi:predicted DNA-binding transcriptional regulator AlpA